MSRDSGPMVSDGDDELRPHVIVVASPNAPRPDDPFVVYIADTLRRIEINYEREGSGPGSRFEGRLVEDVQAQTVVRIVREKDARRDLHAGHDTCPHCHRCRDCGGQHKTGCPSR